MYGLNKVDEPFRLLVWFEEDAMTIRKIKEENFIIVEVQKEIEKISELPSEKRKKVISSLPYKMETEIAKKFNIKGSLPYEIRDWIWRLIHNELERRKPKTKKFEPKDEEIEQARKLLEKHGYRVVK